MADFAFIHNLGEAAAWAANTAAAKPRFQFVYNDAEGQQSSKYRIRTYKASSGGSVDYDSGDVTAVVASGATITHDATSGIANSLGTKAVANIAGATSSSSTDANNYVTGSVTLRAGRLYLLSVENSKGSATADAVSSVTGGAGVPTFTSRSTTTYNSNLNRVSIWSAVPLADYTGTLTINFGGVTQTGAVWALNEIIGADPVTNHGIVQQAVGTGNSGTALATLGAFTSTDNWAFGAMAHAAATATTFGSGFSELSDTTAATPAQALETEYRATSDTSVDATFTSAQWGACAVEIQSAERWWTVEVWDSLGESSGESSRTAFKVRWGQAKYEANPGSGSSNYAFANAGVQAGTAAAFLFGSSASAATDPATWKTTVGAVTPDQWFHILARLQTYTGGTNPTLANMTFTYTAAASQPDKWKSNQMAEISLDPDERRVGQKSLKTTIASGTAGDRYLYPYRLAGTEIIGDEISVLPNTQYIFSAFVKTDAALTGGSLRLRICRPLSNTDTLAQGATFTDTSTSFEGWYRPQVTYTTESGMYNVRLILVYTRTSGVTESYHTDGWLNERGAVASAWNPALAGLSGRFDMAGLMIDALYGGLARFRGSTGGARDVVELGASGWKFGGVTSPVNLYSPSADLLEVDDDLSILGGTLKLNTDTRIDRTATKTLTLDDGAGGALTKVALIGAAALEFGGDASLSRTGADVLATPDAFQAASLAIGTNKVARYVSLGASPQTYLNSTTASSIGNTLLELTSLPGTGVVAAWVWVKCQSSTAQVSNATMAKNYDDSGSAVLAPAFAYNGMVAGFPNSGTGYVMTGGTNSRQIRYQINVGAGTITYQLSVFGYWTVE